MGYILNREVASALLLYAALTILNNILGTRVQTVRLSLQEQVSHEPKRCFS